ncbi:hypothetical protein DRN72_03100 [Methanosarcinales archaeon]|nr:MAG: hypothetical protein DRN72_03100 [Methanosarcinales archaeon]
MKLMWVVVVVLVMASAGATEDVLSQADELYKQGKYEEALSLYKNILSTNPNDVYALYAKGNCLYKMGDFFGAIESYQKALELDPQNYVIMNNLGNAYYAINEYEEAVYYYEKAVEIKEDEKILENLIKAQNAMGDTEGAYKTLELLNAIRLPRYLEEAKSAMEGGDYEEAVYYYEKAVEIKEDPMVWYELSLAQYLTGDVDGAEESIKNAVSSLDPIGNPPEIHIPEVVKTGKLTTISIHGDGSYVSLEIEPSETVWVNGTKYYAPVITPSNSEINVIFGKSGVYVVSVGVGTKKSWDAVDVVDATEFKMLSYQKSISVSLWILSVLVLGMGVGIILLLRGRYR